MIVKKVKRRISFGLSSLLGGLASLGFVFLSMSSDCNEENGACPGKSIKIALASVS